jgi:hypothetical protein
MKKMKVEKIWLKKKIQGENSRWKFKVKLIEKKRKKSKWNLKKILLFILFLKSIQIEKEDWKKGEKMKFFSQSCKKILKEKENSKWKIRKNWKFQEKFERKGGKCSIQMNQIIDSIDSEEWKKGEKFKMNFLSKFKY